jgi:hypothetical protein
MIVGHDAFRSKASYGVQAGKGPASALSAKGSIDFARSALRNQRAMMLSGFPGRVLPAVLIGFIEAVDIRIGVAEAVCTGAFAGA